MEPRPITPLTPAAPWRYALVVIALSALVLSGIGPADGATWFLEAVPVMIAVPALVLTFGRFPMTPLLYGLLLVHGLILLLGAHYTYAEVPPGFWVRDWLDLERNHYDRLGHVAQGFIPAILAREIFLRLSPLRRGGWLVLCVTSVCLAFSAFYEMLEWWVAVFSEQGAAAFLGTQGDVWDTQWDMFLCLTGALAAQLFLSRLHDRQLGLPPR